MDHVDWLGQKDIDTLAAALKKQVLVSVKIFQWMSPTTLMLIARGWSCFLNSLVEESSGAVLPETLTMQQLLLRLASRVSHTV